APSGGFLSSLGAFCVSGVSWGGITLGMRIPPNVPSPALVPCGTETIVSALAISFPFPVTSKHGGKNYFYSSPHSCRNRRTFGEKGGCGLETLCGRSHSVGSRHAGRGGRDAQKSHAHARRFGLDTGTARVLVSCVPLLV